MPYPEPKEPGSHWSQSASATVVYPDTYANGGHVGAVQATAGNSWVSGQRVLVLGYAAGGSIAAGTLTITNGVGTDIEAFTVTGSTNSGIFIQFGEGILSDNGFGFKVSGGTTITVYYQRI